MMQKFIVQFGQPGDDTYISSEALRIAIREATGHREVYITEIPQPPFPTGMDVNSRYPTETLPRLKRQRVFKKGHKYQ